MRRYRSILAGMLTHKLPQDVSCSTWVTVSKYLHLPFLWLFVCEKHVYIHMCNVYLYVCMHT